VLHEFDHLPEGVLDCAPDELASLLPGPSLVHLPGRRPEPLFVSVLLHGNEPTGLHAVQRLLHHYVGRELPRALSVFFGNVAAAQEGVRRLPGQPDYNRVWPGGDDLSSPEAQMMARIVDIMRERRVFASIDIHNNTGLNPHYACVNELRNENLQLATLFGRTVVYFITPRGTQSAAMTRHCPAVTLECGKPGEARGVAHATEFVEACLHLAAVPDSPVAEHDIDLFHTVARVTVPEDVEFAFAPAEAPLVFPRDLEHMNFQEMPAGTPFATCRLADPLCLAVQDEQGRDVARRYFRRNGEVIELRRRVMPSMLTLDARVIRQDCLCYLMERLRLPHGG